MLSLTLCENKLVSVSAMDVAKIVKIFVSPGGNGFPILIALIGALSIYRIIEIYFCNGIVKITKTYFNGVLIFFKNLDHSFKEELQNAFRDSIYVKAFNCVGSVLWVNPDFEIGKLTMFICGNSENSKKEVTENLDLFDWATEDLGEAESACY